MGRLINLLALTFAILLGVCFAVLNSEQVVIHYFLGKKQIPLSVLILAVWVFGILIGLMATSFTILRLRMELRRLRRDHG
jgi:uncharacterized integral membrane protein